MHQLRSRVDGILVGSRTAVIDNPQLTARPSGPRLATRIVFDSQGCLAEELPHSRLAASAREIPVLVFITDACSAERRRKLAESAMEVVVLESTERPQQIQAMLRELGQRRMTNVLVEGGGGLLGALFDAQAIDEVHAFVAPKVIGGMQAVPVLGGTGVTQICRRLASHRQPSGDHRRRRLPAWADRQMNMRDVLLIGLGGAMGAIARHATAVLCLAWWGDRFPWGTLVVNVVGCFALGWLVHTTIGISDSVKLSLGTGFLGAFTTFSTFGVQTHVAWHRSPGLALANVAANVSIGLLAAWVGILFATRWNS